jgi:hypothetical protein
MLDLASCPLSGSFLENKSMHRKVGFFTAGAVMFCMLLSESCSRVAAAPLVIDHNSVAKYAEIPQVWIDRVKTMWLDVPGESHSLGYRLGCELLEAADTRFQVNVVDSGTPERLTTNYLRVSRATWGDVSSSAGWGYSYGEEDWYTSDLAVQRTKAHIRYANTNRFALSVIGFGWCWDMTWINSPGGTVDPVYQVRWAGSSASGPDGSLRWGLDAGDQPLTGNRVCMDTYLNATAQYSEFCKTSGFPTTVFFTTGPVDGGGNTGESGYQRHLKHQHIRNFVRASSDAILFDYADILCWSNGGSEQTTSWTDFGGTRRTYQVIHPDNMLDLDGTSAEDGDHIGKRGALRLGKALWFMLARIAGWDPDSVPSAPPLQASVSTPGIVGLGFNARSNVAYTVQFTSDLTTHPWQTLTNIPVQPADCSFQVHDPITPAGHRFYRVQQAP